MKFVSFIFSLSLFNCLLIYKDTYQTELNKNALNQSDVDIVYYIREKTRLTDAEYSSAILLGLRKENYFANPKVFSKNEYFFINDPSKYKIVLDIDESNNFNSSWRSYWFKSSILTFGMIPFHGKFYYHYTVKIYSKEKKLLKEFEYKNEADGYIHLLLFPFSDAGSISRFDPSKEIFKRIAKEINLLP